ncbi:MAG: hypothetical protein QGG54_16645, partial [Gammaproteobacteria bacterium]|nr:hypothetical protein [Gammaproteobacteria bacterium]
PAGGIDARGMKGVTVLIATLFILILMVFVLCLLFAYGSDFPQAVQRFLAIFFLVISALEIVLIIWVLIYVLVSDWSLWGLSFDEFWRSQLAIIYPFKEWLYTWLWNELLDLLFVFLPAVVFLSIRTVFTTVIGIWFLKLSKVQG